MEGGPILLLILEDIKCLGNFFPRGKITPGPFFRGGGGVYATRGHEFHNLFSSSPINPTNQNIVTITLVVLEKLKCSQDARFTMYDDGRKRIAIGHQSYSVDLTIILWKKLFSIKYNR